MTQRPARVVFLGTPDFAVPSLEALVGDPRYTVVGVVTQPDRPAGRGRQKMKSAVKLAAEKHDLPVLQPETLRDQTAVDHLRAWSPGVLVVAAFGQILRRTILDLPPYGCVNVHASLLPRWRGAAPIQYAIQEGDAQTGITIMQMDVGLDTGPIIAQRAIPIDPDETGSTLHDKLAALGTEMLPDTLFGYLNREIMPHPQPEIGVTFAPTLKKTDGGIDWSQPAEVIDRRVRAYTPWPGTLTYLGEELLKIIKGKPLSGSSSRAIGTLTLHDSQVVVQTGSGLYRLDDVQLAGKQKTDGLSFLRGHADALGAVLSSRDPA